MTPVAICPVLERHSWDARLLARRAASARDTLAYYEIHPDVEPYTPIRELRHELTFASNGEAECLRLINAAMLASGFEVGRMVEIDGELYSASNPGGMAVHLGHRLPTDEIEIDDEPEGETSADEVSGWARDYAMSTRWEG